MPHYVDTNTGRSFGDLDALLCHMAAEKLVGEGNGYTVFSADGGAILGMVPNDPEAPRFELDAPMWRRA